jgi:hypothetical protein
MRIRHAYGEWGQVLAGQTNSLFMDGDIFPNIIEYWGPVGMAFVRKTQLRWTPWRDQNNSFAIAVEDPGNDIDVGTIRQFDPNLGANITNDEKWPDLTMAYRNQGDWGHFQLAGIFRNVRYETIGTVDHRPKGSEPGWGVDVSGHVNTWDRDKLLLGVVYGSGIASYMNDGGVDLAPEGAFPNAVRPKAVPSLGISAYYDHYWDQKWSTSLGYSLHQQDNANLQDPSAYKLGEYASINLLYAPVPKLTMGGELQWGQRKDFNLAAGDDIRFQFSVKYDFGVSVGL